MTIWTIIPRDPLIFRDGKPFTAEGSAGAISLPFPYPSTIAGAVRTLAGPAADGEFTKARIAELLGMGIRGPLLVELNDAEQIEEWLLPAPADAVFLKTEDTKNAMRIQLLPQEPPQGAETDIGCDPLACPVSAVMGKPHPDAPRYWRWSAYESWLTRPAEGACNLQSLGHQGPVHEQRMHTALDPQTGTVLSGALFQTSALEFTQLNQVEGVTRPKLGEVKNLALAIETGAVLKEGYGFVGGERRVALWKKSGASLINQPQCLSEISTRIGEAKACRLLLITPAYFEKGHLPTWLLDEFNIEIIAAAVQRYQVVSGWSYEKKRPKVTRRLAPSGSVYFLRFNDPAKIEDFIQATWLQPVSDVEQDRLDGFGLALLGTWDGRPKPMEVGS